MLITRLYLRDFRSYGRAEIDLSELRAATIVGRNGAGKSTLAVDAMLWALYGQVRGAGADSVVRLGQMDCAVEIDFEAGAAAYRVIRKRSRRNNGKSELDLYRVDGAALVPMSGKTIADTQAEIERVVGVGFETLVAASVIQQGDAARFTKAAPEKRREILRSVLGLERYKQLAADARRRAAEVQAQHNALAPDLERADALASRLTEAAEVLAVTEADEHRARGTVAAAEHAEQQARAVETDARAAAQVEQARLDERPALVARVRAAMQAAEDAENNVSFLSMSADLSAVARAEAQLPAARARVAEAEQRHDGARLAAQANAAAERQAREAEQQIEAAHRRRPTVDAKDIADARRAADLVASGEEEVARLRAHRDAAGAELERLMVAAANIEADAELVRIYDESRAAAAGAEQMADEAQAQHPGRFVTADAFGKLQQIAEKVRAAEKTAGLLSEAPCAAQPAWFDPSNMRPKGTDLAGTCPLLANARDARDRLPSLRSDLDAADAEHARLQEAQRAAEYLAALAEGKRKDANRLQADAARRRADLVNAAQVEQAAARTVLRQAEAALADAEQILSTRNRRAARLPQLEALADRAAAVDLEIGALRDRLRAARLAMVPFPEPEADAAAVVQRARAELARLERIAGGREAAERAAAQLVEARAALGRANAAVTEARAALDACKADEAVTKRAADAAEALQRAVSDAAAARGAHRAAVVHLESARANVARIEAELAALAEKRAEADRLAADARHWARTAEALELAAVLLIEQAIPALEQEANAVLARVSSRGMQVRLDTQRALKSRDGMRETLDIVIRDDIGERTYEDFSGGEQFRVDMALRLGLARLLAERDGFSVDMLTVDEGSFGALDQEGIGALKDVLAGLQQVYRLILVVSHIPEVADALPHRIEVQQGENGSQIVGAGVRRAA